MWPLKQYKNNIALVEDNGTKLTYSDLILKSNELYSKIGNRCLVFILCNNSIGSILGYISCIENHVVPLMLNENINILLLNKLITAYRPRFIYCKSDYDFSIEYSNIKQNDGINCCNEHEILHKEIYSSEFGFSLFEIHYCLNSLKSSIKYVYFDGYKINDNLALLLSTSGSTGSPKFVRQSYKNIESNAKAIVEYLHLDSNERPITSLPMNYTYGLSVINSHLMVGATICVTNATLAQKEFWTFFKENKVTSIAGVPYNYEILDKLRFTRMELPYLNTMTQAGGKLSLELHEKFANYAKEKNKNFVVMYGQCEATARMGYLPPDKSLDKIGSMGIPIPGGKFYLIDNNGNEINTPETIGELIYEGDNVTLGYAECGEDLIKGDVNKRRLATGDMAKFDKDGYYYIVGRKKRFLKVFGNRVNLDELERYSKTKFSIDDIAISGVDDHVKIFVVDEKIGNEIKSYIIDITKLNHSAFDVIKVEKIPRNDSGKILYSELNKI